MINITSGSEGFVLTTEQRLSVALDDVFAFFADARNLENITPPWLNFKVLTEGDMTMREGLTIDYAIRLKFIYMRWQSEITAWEPPFRFVDVQRKGPYRYWIHEHTFDADGTNTIVRDNIRYGVPGGRLVHDFFVAHDLRRIFEYRRQKMIDLFEPEITRT